MATTDEQIRTMLEEGFEKAEISRVLGISLSVVSARSLRMGYRSRPGPPPRYDWAAIRDFYEAGHTARECRERFGFSPGAWDQAIVRGDIRPREEPDPVRHEHRTRSKVAALLKAGRTQTEISAELGISKSTVSFHARSLGKKPDSRFSRRYDWDAIQQAYDSGLSLGECSERFGFSKASWSQAVGRGAITPRPRAMPLDQLLHNGTKRSRHNLKRRLMEEGLKANRCELCGISEWSSKPLNMALHHVNGDNRDNRLENLQILCPNCHAQTTNYGGRNGHRRKP
jgi:hypothetical protein